ncbi:EamA family transporter [Candidatus Dojkabacteria bacterium]|nr:EamA family transporter [Candidatus Dojkabacteria bacterium]
MNNSTKALIFATIAAFAGSTVSVTGKYALEVFHPFTVVMIRFFFASAFLAPFVVKSHNFALSNYRKVFWVSVLGALNPIIFFIGLQYTRAILTNFLYASVPGMTALYLYFIKGQSVSFKKAMGVLLGLFGVGIIVFLPLISEHDKIDEGVTVYGNVIVVIAVICFMFYGLRSKIKQTSMQISPLLLTFYFTLTTFFISIPFSLYEILTSGLSEEIGFVHIFSVISIGIVGTGILYIAYQYALKLRGELSASVFTFMMPAIGLVLASVTLGDPITMPLIAGGAMALVGAKLAS